MNKYKRRKLKKKLKENKSKIIVFFAIFFILSVSVGYAASNILFNVSGHAIISPDIQCEDNITGSFSTTGAWGQQEGARIIIDNYEEKVLENFIIEMKVPDGTTVGPFSDCVNNTVDDYLVPDANGIVTISFHGGENSSCLWLSQINAASSNNGVITPTSWAGGSGFHFQIHNDLITSENELYPDYVKFNGCVIYGEAENDDDLPLTALGLSPNSSTIGIGEILNLVTTKTPASKNVNLTYTSSDPTVATVDNHGTVTGISEGTATITVSAEGIMATSTITVENITVTPQSIEITPSSYRMSIDETVPLQVSVSPSNASIGTLSWSSSNTSVATVDSSGNVTANQKGTTTITVTSGELSSTCEITVIEPVNSNSISTSFEIINGYTSGNSYMFRFTINNLTDQQINYFNIGLDLPSDITWTLWQNNVSAVSNYLELIRNEWTYIPANGSFVIQGSINFPDTYLEDGDDGYGNYAKVIPTEYRNPEIIDIALE